MERVKGRVCKYKRGLVEGAGWRGSRPIGRQEDGEGAAVNEVAPLLISHE